MASFLDIIERVFGPGAGAGAQHGGVAGHDGSGLPTGAPSNFMFATGIECSAPMIGNGRIRRDMLAECGHYDRWREDLHLVRDLGLRVLRYGLPLHRIFLGPDRFDWEFADLAMAEMRRLGITPILDLCHFGLPDWLGDFQNPAFPVHFARYCGAVAERYPWVRFFTPVNEIYVTAKFSAREGLWNEQLCSDQAFVSAIKHCAAANTLGTLAIAERRPDCIIVQSESAEVFHELKALRSRRVSLVNKQRFIALDLLYAHPPDAEIMLYLLDNGMTRAEYEWFMSGEPPGYHIMGNDYYGRNEHIITPDGRFWPAEDVMGWYQITKEYHDRYLKPVMHTETNVFDADEAPTWLWKQWVNILRMREDGVPVLGFTWYSLTDQIDWHIGLAERRGIVNACGLFDLDRRPRPVADAYRCLLEEFGNVTIVPHADVFQLSNDPARLKFAI